MAFKIVTASERMNQPRSIKGAIFGPHGIGKTSLLWTLDPAKTLFLNLEAGDIAVKHWPGDSIEINSWMEAVNLACLAGGPDLSLVQADDGTWPLYSKPHYDFLVNDNPELVETLGKYETHFWDSISVASRHAWNWAIGQPGSFSEKTGKRDTRGTYRIIGQDIVQWLTRIQHTKGKNIFVVGGLDNVKDEFKREYWAPQIEGAKAAREMLGIFDLVISMMLMPGENGTKFRAFVTKQENPWGYPAKDRTGQLDLLEEPHLGRLVDKIAPLNPTHAAHNYAITEPATEGEE